MDDEPEAVMRNQRGEIIAKRIGGWWHFEWPGDFSGTPELMEWPKSDWHRHETKPVDSYSSVTVKYGF